MARHAAPAGAKQGKRAKSRYVPALDGLRAFAVLAVIFYHMGLGWAPGGLMGVTVFFVISGYLINGLLVAEHEQTGTISLKSFWLRRVRRLFPAIFLSVVGTAALCTIFDHTLLDKMRPDIAPSLCSTTTGGRFSVTCRTSSKPETHRLSPISGAYRSRSSSTSYGHCFCC